MICFEENYLITGWFCLLFVFECCRYSLLFFFVSSKLLFFFMKHTNKRRERTKNNTTLFRLCVSVTEIIYGLCIAVWLICMILIQMEYWTTRRIFAHKGKTENIDTAFNLSNAKKEVVELTNTLAMQPISPFAMATFNCIFTNRDCGGIAQCVLNCHLLEYKLYFH